MNSILLKNAKLLDARYNYQPANVRVEDGRIAAIGPACGDEADEVYDLTGYTLMPGFFNSHLHLTMGSNVVSDELFAKMVRRGVTAVRDMSALNDMSIAEVMELKQTWCTEDHPYVFTSCKTIATRGGYGDFTPDGIHVGIYAETPEGAVKLVDELAAAGADGIKIGIQAMQEDDPGIMPSEMVRAIVRRAKEHGIWLAAHVVQTSFLKRLIDDGVTEAAHVPGDHMPDELIEEMIQKGIILTPTITTYEQLSKILGPQTIPLSIDNVSRYYRAGGIITLGTDSMPNAHSMQGFDMPMSELRYLVRAGMSPRDIVIAATQNSALACGVDDILGTISKGKLASLIAVRGELDAEMEVMNDVQFVLHKGVVVTRPADLQPVKV